MWHNIGAMSTTTELIRQLKAKGLTQTDIAKRTGIPQPRLSKWANGRVPAGADDALKLLALFELIGTEGAPGAPTTQQTEA